MGAIAKTVSNLSILKSCQQSLVVFCLGMAVAGFTCNSQGQVTPGVDQVPFLPLDMPGQIPDTDNGGESNGGHCNCCYCHAQPYGPA